MVQCHLMMGLWLFDARQTGRMINKGTQYGLAKSGTEDLARDAAR